MNRYMHQFVIDYLCGNVTDEDTVVDATVGNGNDTLLLARLASFVFGFDIQAEAIKETDSLLKISGIDNYKLILDSHENILNHVKKFKGVVFNLGYLPRSNKKVTTKASTTITALKKLTTHLKKDNFILLTCYRGHKEGLVESEAVLEFVNALDETFNVLKYEHINKPTTPFVVVIEKK